MYSSIAAIIAAYSANEIPRGMVPDELMNFITEQNVDQVIQELPDDLRSYFVRWARRVYSRIPLPSNDPGSDERVPDQALRAVQEWLARHPES